MIYIKCGDGMDGATVATWSAQEAVETSRTLQSVGVEIVGFANDFGDPIPKFALMVMATNKAILISEVLAQSVAWAL